MKVSAANVPVQVPVHFTMTESSRLGDGSSEDIGTGGGSLSHTVGHGSDFHGLSSAFLCLHVAADTGDNAGADTDRDQDIHNDEGNTDTSNNSPSRITSSRGVAVLNVKDFAACSSIYRPIG